MMPSNRLTFPHALLAITACVLSGCATVQGYPTDPEDSKATLDKLKPAFDGTDEVAYYALPERSAGRDTSRNAIIVKRLRGYDLTYAQFTRQLLGTSNSLNLGTDLAGIALGGLTSTVGGAGAKSALGAASAGILGANAAINKDIFYQKTIPALISQMDANRAKALLPILKGMTLGDDKYPLAQAMSDLGLYRDAGSLPSAISTITETANKDKQVSEATTQREITFLRAAGSETQIPLLDAIAAQLKALGDSQVLAVAAAMQGKLSDRPAGIQSLVQGLDPNAQRATDADVARKVLNAWLFNEDLTDTAAKDWTTAIAAAK